MATPFPGMDPFLEHPVLWSGVQLSLMNAVSHQLAPLLRPRYVPSLEVRTIELPWFKHREYYLELLDRYQDLKVVTVIEVLSPTNKHAGPGREAFLKKQESTLASECHLVEIDLLREGQRLAALPEKQLAALGAFDSLITVNRWPKRQRFEFYPLRLRDRLPRFGVPLVAPDPDVPLDLQAAFEQVYDDGSYMLRVKYHEPCVPPLSPDDQKWADERWTHYRQAHSEWFSKS